MIRPSSDHKEASLPVLFYAGLRIAVLISSIFLIPLVGYCGECLESDEEMYQGMLQSYEEAKDGKALTYFGWISQGCWGIDRRHEKKRGEGDLTRQLLDLFRNMIKDPQLHEETKAAVINLYGTFSGADDFLLEQFRTATGKPRAAIMSRLMTADDTAHFSRSNFLKEHAAKEVDLEMQKELLHHLAQATPFPEFRTYCAKNGIAITEEFLVKDYPADLNALAYLYDTVLSKRPTPDIRDPVSMTRYFSYSSHIYGVLARNLDAEFPTHYLKSIRSGELRWLRNGIMAYYGKHFRSKALEYYFYGSYPYIQRFCRQTGCGAKEKPAKGYRDSNLTKNDLANINAIAAIEDARQKAGYKEINYFVENYDLASFIKGAADNVTLSEKDMNQIYQLKLDWTNKSVWLWDRKGVSCWSLETGKRIKFYKRGTGPLAFHGKTRLLAYQMNNEVVLENTDTGAKVYRAELGRFEEHRPDKILNTFSTDGSFFVYIDYNVKTWQSDMKIVNTSNGSIRLVKPLPDISFRFYDIEDRGERLGNPLVFLDKNKYIVARVNIGSNLHCDKNDKKAIMILPLNEPDKMRLIPTDTCAIALDAKNDEVYFDQGGGPIMVFKSRDILAAVGSMPASIRSLKVGNADIRYMKRLIVSDAFIIRVDYSYFGFLPLTGSDQGNTKILAITHIFDIDLDASIVALADPRGFVVVRNILDLAASAQ